MNFTSCSPLGTSYCSGRDSYPGETLTDWAQEESADGGVEYKLEFLWKTCHASTKLVGDSFVNEC